MTPRLLTLLSVLFLTAAPALAQSFDALPPDSRIRILPYDSNDIYTVITQVGYQTNIEFGQGEEIETISVGDRSFWQLIPSGNRLFIRPLEQDVATNMTVITNRHSYQFDLKSADSKDPGIVYVARFRYPGAEPKRPPQPQAQAIDPFLMEPVALPPASAPAIQPVQPAPLPGAPPGPPAARNYLYTFSGPDAVAPYEVYDDGQSTYMRYRDPATPPPGVALVDKTGKETPLPVYARDGYYVVDIVAPELVVENKGGRIFVFNEMLSPAP